MAQFFFLRLHVPFLYYNCRNGNVYLVINIIYIMQDEDFFVGAIQRTSSTAVMSLQVCIFTSVSLFYLHLFLADKLLVLKYICFFCFFQDDIFHFESRRRASVGFESVVFFSLLKFNGKISRSVRRMYRTKREVNFKFILMPFFFIHSSGASTCPLLPLHDEMMMMISFVTHLFFFHFGHHSVSSSFLYIN